MEAVRTYPCRRADAVAPVHLSVAAPVAPPHVTAGQRHLPRALGGILPKSQAPQGPGFFKMVSLRDKQGKVEFYA